jgi:hypothetical protein
MFSKTNKIKEFNKKKKNLMKKHKINLQLSLKMSTMFKNPTKSKEFLCDQTIMKKGQLR